MLCTTRQLLQPVHEIEDGAMQGLNSEPTSYDEELTTRDSQGDSQQLSQSGFTASLGGLARLACPSQVSNHGDYSSQPSSTMIAAANTPRRSPQDAASATPLIKDERQKFRVRQCLLDAWILSAGVAIFLRMAGPCNRTGFRERVDPSTSIGGSGGNCALKADCARVVKAPEKTLVPSRNSVMWTFPPTGMPSEEYCRIEG